MDNIDIQKTGTDTIIIDDKLAGLVTITTEDLSEQNLSNNFIYKICPDGKIINSAVEDKTDKRLNAASVKNSKETIFEKLIKEGFEQIPENFTKLELTNILEFSKKEIVKNINFARVFPFSVEVTANYDIKVVLLAYNGAKNATVLTQFPFKLKDAKDNVLIVGSIDINKTISPSRTVICEVQIEKARLSEQLPDLSNWTVTFEAK